MKNRWKNTAFFAQALVLCLCLAACGNSDDVAGDDWRTTGMVVDSGTITHDGDSVDVLVTVSESSAAFYRDIPEQEMCIRDSGCPADRGQKAQKVIFSSFPK